ncbi:chemotaxis protein CheW [Desulfonema magnum]|uniref:CheW domain-containing protein n=1 Tax=Desulfonema magnum TaxID=45655 RepID=A0A975BT26_9BACT|nr:chemotaxis protein CheW [Desulfonema magnum]QTA91145.1 CheW domain-containing protein [Desulfonema magnum]
MIKADGSDASFKKKLGQLEKENKKLRKKIERLNKTMEITSRHGDVVAGELEERVEASIKEIESHVRIISETIPVPVIIARISDGKIFYVNEHSCHVFGFSSEEFLKHNALELYKNSSDRKIFLDMLAQEGQVKNFEVRLKKKNRGILWADLFSQSLTFKDEPCVLTVIYDLTDRREAEREIRRLRKELDQKEIKYLMFELDEEEYGIEIIKVREIVGMMPITAVNNTPPYVKGVINLRDQVIPVTDLRLRLGLKETAYTNQTSIIIIESEAEENNTVTGIIVDTVTDVLGIRARDVEEPSALNFKTDNSFISGIAKIESHIKILIKSDYL